MNFNRGREVKKTKVEIIPMIDTMFFLLVFFILSSIGVIKLQGLNINLPKPVPNMPPPPPDRTGLTVSIDKDKHVSVNNKPVGAGGDIRPFLQLEITRQKGDDPDMKSLSVVISADPTVPHGMVVRCIDQARALHISNFSIATAPDGKTADK